MDRLDELGEAERDLRNLIARSFLAHRKRTAEEEAFAWAVFFDPDEDREIKRARNTWARPGNSNRHGRPDYDSSTWARMLRSEELVGQGKRTSHHSGTWFKGTGVKGPCRWRSALSRSVFFKQLPDVWARGRRSAQPGEQRFQAFSHPLSCALPGVLKDRAVGQRSLRHLRQRLHREEGHSHGAQGMMPRVHCFYIEGGGGAHKWP